MATAIDDNAAYEKSDKSIWWLLNIRCTSGKIIFLSLFEKAFCKIYCKVGRADCGNVFQNTLHSATEINILM